MQFISFISERANLISPANIQEFCSADDIVYHDKCDLEALQHARYSMCTASGICRCQRGEEARKSFPFSTFASFPFPERQDKHTHQLLQRNKKGPLAVAVMGDFLYQDLEELSCN